MEANVLAKPANGEKRPRRVYARMYTYWFSFSFSQWVDFCKAAYVTSLHGDGFTIPPEREIGRFPSHATFIPIRGGRDVMARTGYRVVEPLDWDEESFKEELAALGVYICPDCSETNGAPVELYFDNEPGPRYAQCPSCGEPFVSVRGQPAEYAI